MNLLIKYIISVYLCCLLVPLALNYYADPLYLLNRKNGFPVHGDERVIKRAYIQNNPKKYSALIIGSSRASYIDSGQFRDKSVFNASVSGIHIDEYEEIIEHYCETQGTPQIVYLCLDFMLTNNNTPKPQSNKVNPTLSYLKLATASKAFASITGKGINDYYSRDMIKQRVNNTPMSHHELKETKVYYKRFVFNEYAYSPGFKKKLQNLREKYPDTTFLPIILPIHDELLKYIIEITNSRSYVRFKSEIKEVFAEIVDLSSEAKLTKNKAYFFDPAHFFPFVSNIIVERINSNAKKLTNQSSQ